MSHKRPSKAIIDARGKLVKGNRIRPTLVIHLNDGNVARKTVDRIDSFIAGVAGKRLTYQALIQ